MPQTATYQEHVLEAAVSGPDGANRLLTVTGSAGVQMYLNAGQQQTETWTFLVGPTLTRQQFHRAVGTAAISQQNITFQQTPGSYQVAINSVEADWDDEGQKVEVRVEVFAQAAQGVTLVISNVRYFVTILAET